METNSSNFPPQLPVAPPSFGERIFSSVLAKLAIIFILMLLLLIPMNLIQDLIVERKNREVGVTDEISAKWGREQVISSPVLAIPYEYTMESLKKDNKGNDLIVKTQEVDWIFLLANTVDIKTTVTPENRKRGIFQSVVYSSAIKLKGDFAGLDASKLTSQESQNIRWNEAKLVFGIRDLKGLSKSPSLKWDTTSSEMGTFENRLQLFESNLVANVPLKGIEDTKKNFEINLELRGSKSLNFFPIAKQTNIEVDGKWSNPSFNGGFLPDVREVAKTNFTASWSIPSFSRTVPQQWTGTPERLYSFLAINLNEEAHMTEIPMPEMHAVAAAHDFTQATDQDMVQINFLPEVNNYQKTTRVAKYGILVILLTFASLFFTEIIKKQRVHIIQYILIGMGMVLFYTLLLAISEHLGFNIAYLISAVATVGLIASFIYGITKDKKTALLFVGVLCLFYSFIYILMQLRDYSLIVGALGIFIILAVLMRVSTKVNWYQFDKR